MTSTKRIEEAYAIAKEQYAFLGVDTDKAVEKLAEIPISLYCWEGDNIGGFESPDAKLTGGGIQATGSYPGKAGTADEIRCDLDKAMDLIPGTCRVNLQASYAEPPQPTERNELRVEHFSAWIDWAKGRKIGMDFNPTFFSHPKSDGGFTLSHAEEGIRRFWIDHGIAARKIGTAMGKALGSPCVTNIWVPDGYKDTPIDRKGPRERLKESLDVILQEKIDPKYNLDAVEAKLFGLGLESYTVGSHEFYLGYAVRNNILPCFDTGHYHPTETISDKISAALMWVDELLLHISRGVRWDSDHVTILSDETRGIAEELVRGDYLQRAHISLDFFDASINRVAAWVVGARCVLKALLMALVEPIETLRACENEGDFTGRLALLEECRTLPFGAVWDHYCLKCGVPIGPAWLEEIRTYEKNVLSKRA